MSLEFHQRPAETLNAPSLAARLISATAYASTGRLFVFDTATTDADPTSGKLRLNNATAASATAAYIDNLDFFGAATPTWLDSFDDAGSSSHRGLFHIEQRGNQGNFADYRVTGSVVDGTGYRKLTLAFVGGNLVATAGMVLSTVFFGRGADGSSDAAVLSTRADIASYAPASAPDWLWTMGYAAIGDGGGGLWIKRGSEPGSVGVPGFFKDQIADNTWYELYIDGHLDLRAAGYLADGTTDNGPMITAAAAWLGSNLGGTLVVPLGIGKCTTVPVIENSGITLRGVSAGSSQDDAGSILKLAIVADGPKMLLGIDSAVLADRTLVVEVRDLRLVGTGGAGPLIQTRYLRDVRLANLTIQNGNGGFVSLGQGTLKTNFAFIHEIEGNVNGVGLVAAIDCPNFGGGIDFEMIEIEGPASPIAGSLGFDVASTATVTPDGSRIVNCIFGLFDTGLRIGFGIRNLACVGVQLDRCGTHGIDLTITEDTRKIQFIGGHIVGLRTTGKTINTTNGSTTVVVSSITGIVPGQFIQSASGGLAAGIPSGTTVATIVDSTHITISVAATASASGTAVQFFNGGYGVRLNRAADEMYTLHIDLNHITTFGRGGFLCTAAGDWDGSHNLFEDCAVAEDNVYDVITVAGSSTRYTLAHNQSRNLNATNNPRYGINLSGTGAVRNVESNQIQDYQTLPVIVANKYSLVTDRRVNNTGDGMKGSFVLGPFFLADLAGTASDVQMTLEGPAALGSFSAPPMARDGCVVGITVRSNAARTAGTATFSPYINGSVDATLQAVLNVTDTTFKAATKDSGIRYVAGDVVRPGVTTSGWTPTTADAIAYLHCKDD